MGAAPPPRVCVVIISYNSSLTLPQCLDSLAGQTFTDFCLLLIDNASDERPRPDLSRFPFPASYVEMEENLGFAQAMNVALGSTVSPLLAALNPDAFPAAEWLAELVATADQYADVAAFGSLQISAADHKRIDGFGSLSGDGAGLARRDAARGRPAATSRLLLRCLRGRRAVPDRSLAPPRGL